jgi:general secretion pathway protein H
LVLFDPNVTRADRHPNVTRADRHPNVTGADRRPNVTRADRRDPKSGGFTLIETIVVLVILGLALTITAGFIARPNTTLKLTAATARVTGALRLARSRAIAESRSVSFAVAPDGHGFRLDNRAVTLDPSIVMAMPEPRVIFFEPDGSASGGLLHVSMRGQERVIRIDWLTGRVSVANTP